MHRLAIGLGTVQGRENLYAQHTSTSDTYYN